MLVYYISYSVFHLLFHYVPEAVTLLARNFSMLTDLTPLVCQETGRKKKTLLVAKSQALYY